MMRFRIYLTNLVICLVLVSEAGAQLVPGKVYGGPQNDQAFSVCLLRDGNYAVTGRTRSQGAGANDVWVLKIDKKNGKVLWSSTFGSELVEQGHWVEPSPDGGLAVMAYTNGLPKRAGRYDYCLIKLDEAGREEWSELYGGRNRDIGFCVQEAYGGGYVMVGYSKTDNLRGDIWVVRVDRQGKQVWDKLIESPFVDYGHQIAKTEDQGYLIIGSESGFYYPSSLDHAKDNSEVFLIKIDSSGNELWRKTYGGRRHELGRAMCAASGGGWYLFGSTQSEGAGSFDQFLIRVNADGDSLWSRTYGGAEWDYGNSIDMDAEGNLYLLGTTYSFGTEASPDIWLQKTDPEGKVLWSLSMGGPGSDYGYQVRAFPAGGCLVVGSTRSYGAGGEDIFLTRVSADGHLDYLDSGIKWKGGTLYPVQLRSDSLPVPVLDRIAFSWKLLGNSGKLKVRETLESGFRSTLPGFGLRRRVYLYEFCVDGQNCLAGKQVMD